MTAIGWVFLVLSISALCALWGFHMWAMLKDIAKEDAEEKADEMFRDYIEHCEYRVHMALRIVDEMKKRR